MQEEDEHKRKEGMIFQDLSCVSYPICGPVNFKCSENLVTRLHFKIINDTKGDSCLALDLSVDFCDFEQRLYECILAFMHDISVALTFRLVTQTVECETSNGSQDYTFTGSFSIYAFFLA